MAQRDYRAEYERRKQRAVARGYRSYSHKRKTQEHAKDWVERVLDRMEETGLLDSGFIDPEAEFEDEDSLDVSILWELFRNYYGKASAA